MLSETAVAQKCEEAKEGHDRPFVVEWDATDLASFEAAALQRTLFVRYEGCSLKVLYECRDPRSIGRFGTYGQPQFTSGTVQGIDIDNQGELYSKLPLGAATLSGKLQENEALHLRYYVAGVATSTRETLYQDEIAEVGGCEGATHFVWGFNLGAFQLETSSRTAAEVQGGVAGVGGGGASGSRARADLGHGGSIESCSTQDQRGCRVPIRLALRPVRPGKNPLDQPGAMAAVSPGSPGEGPQLPAELQEKLNLSKALQEAQLESNRLLHAGDGVACLQQLDRMLALDPRSADNHGLQHNYPRCQMLAGQCDEGKKRLRELLASQDTKRIRSDQDLDFQVRNVANQTCSSATAHNDIDFVLRASKELSATAAAKDTKQCKAGFEVVFNKIKAADAQAKKEREENRTASTNQSPWNMGTSALSSAAHCIAEGESCAEGLKYHRRAYCLQLRDSKTCEKIAESNWDTQRQLGRISCK